MRVRLVSRRKLTWRLLRLRSLNQPFTRLHMRRRYESWFLRLGLPDGSGAWWFRYLLTNPGRSGCQGAVPTAPCQVWATWFPQDEQPESCIQEFPLTDLKLSAEDGPFTLQIGSNAIEDNACRGAIDARGKRITWDLHYRSNFQATLSNKGWIGFSRTPHSDTVFSGEIVFDSKVFRGNPLGLGVQGHNCGFRHREFWTWMHAVFPQKDGSLSSFEALVYEMPFGLVFRKAVLWHQGQPIFFRKLRESRRDRQQMHWIFTAQSKHGTVEVTVDGAGSIHRVAYTKTDCRGTFEVSNNSLASAQLKLHLRDAAEELSTDDGAVLEMAGDYSV